MALPFAHLPRIRLAFTPTPLHRLERLTKALGGPEIWIKRDDMTGAGGGGNKVRKLEFLLGEALARNADTVVTGGAVQSNHVRQTAAVCGALGLACEAVLSEGSPGRGADYGRNGNVFLTRLSGARLHTISQDADSAAEIEKVAERLRAAGRRPYVVPIGGSTPLGALGYVSAGLEICDQAREMGVVFDAVVLASGSGGTQAGLIAALALAGGTAAVYGISVGAPMARQRQKVLDILPGLSALVERPLKAEAVLIDDRSTGPAYGVPSEEMKEALAMLATQEGLYLDPVYTGKAMAGLVHLCRSRHFRSGQNVLFLHTGGLPGLFGYCSELERKEKE
jgi:D-cysteine desulfhydrase family pyridoxal phosphate-dependent enzyme